MSETLEEPSGEPLLGKGELLALGKGTLGEPLLGKGELGSLY